MFASFTTGVIATSIIIKYGCTLIEKIKKYKKEEVKGINIF